MKLETRLRTTTHDGIQETHHDLLFISEHELESELLDLLGQPGSHIQGEVRLADGHGDCGDHTRRLGVPWGHYLMVQPRMKVLVGGDIRLFPERLVKPKSDPQRAATPGPRKKDEAI